MKCSICGTDNHDGVGFCRHCGVSIAGNGAAAGAPAAATATCARCGQTHAVPARFCDQCGTRVSAPSPGTASYSAPAAGAAISPASMPKPPAASALPESPDALSRAVAIPPGGRTASRELAHRPNFSPTAPPLAGRLPPTGRTGPAQGRRRLQLIGGLTLAAAGIILSGFLMAQTLLVGHPPWQKPESPALPDAAAIAAAEGETTPASWAGEAGDTVLEAARALPGPENGDAVILRQAHDIASTTSLSGDDVPLPVAGMADEAIRTVADTALPETMSAASGSGPQDRSLVQEPPAPVRSAVTAGRTAGLPTGMAGPATAPPRKPAAERAAEPLPPTQKNGAGEPAAQRHDSRRSTALAASTGWYASMKKQLHACADDPNLFSRIICTEKTKFRFCSPDRWGQVAECVKTRFRDGSNAYDLGGSLHIGRPSRLYG